MKDYRLVAAIDQYHDGIDLFCAVADNDTEPANQRLGGRRCRAADGI
jgi:hypothetical protein